MKSTVGRNARASRTRSLRNSAIPPLHAGGLHYDEIIVLTFFDNSMAPVRDGSKGSWVYLDANVLVDLENCKTGLEDLIIETYGQVDQIAKAALSFPRLDTLFITDVDYFSPAVPKAFIDQMNEFGPKEAAASQINVSSHLFTAQSWFVASGPLTLGSGGYVASESNYDVINCCSPTEFFSSAPGYLSPFDLYSAVVSPFVFLPCFLLLGEISKYEELRALIVAAIATLFLRLRSIVVSRAIAVCQRSFFIHHGSHPPEGRSEVCLGTFSGRVSQPQVAA